MRGKMMPKKRVLLVHNYYQIGGGEHTVFENEQNLLKKNGHEVYTYTRSNDELKTEKWKLLLLPFTTVWSFRTFFQVRQILHEKKIDIVHCHNTFPLISPSVYYAARSLKIPVIQTIHNFRLLCPNGLFFCDGKICEECRWKHSFLPALIKRCYRGSGIQTAVVIAMLKFHRWLGTYKKINYIFLTEFNKEKFDGLVDANGPNIFVKPNFVYGKDIHPDTTRIKNKFIYAGRLDENKGIRFLLEVWPMLPKEYELHIYGDGKYREACEAASVAHGNIHFMGFCPQEEVFADLADAVALVFPSNLYEGYPMIIAESFAMGRPVLCADLGNQGELVRKSRGGTTYECGNKESFSAAIKHILAENEQYSKNARNYYEVYLNEYRNYEMLSEIYDKAKHIR